jgi:hypothetical protein
MGLFQSSRQTLKTLTPNLLSQPQKVSPVTLGTTGAQQEMSMKKADKMPKSAGWAEQVLPEEQLAADGVEIAAQQPLPTTTSPHNIRGEPVSQPDSTFGDDDVATATTSTTSSSSTAADGLRSLERIHDLVALHALRLSNTGTDSLHVVVEPGNGTRLSLELRQGPGGIETQAFLHRGDVDFLSQHWPQLQQRLESRGVRLSPLRSSTQPSVGGQSQISGRQQTKADSTKSTEFAFGGSMTESPAAKRARTKTHGWGI